MNFANFPPGTQLITYDPSVPGKGGQPVEVFALNVALYWAPLGSTEAQLVQIGTIGSIAPIPGIFSAGTRTTGCATPGRVNALFQVRAWSAGFLSYEAAIASGDPTKFAGKSKVFENATDDPNKPPPTLPAALTGFTSFGVVPIPEPSTILLGILGAGVLLLRRR